MWRKKVTRIMILKRGNEVACWQIVTGDFRATSKGKVDECPLVRRRMARKTGYRNLVTSCMAQGHGNLTATRFVAHLAQVNRNLTVSEDRTAERETLKGSVLTRMVRKFTETIRRDTIRLVFKRMTMEILKLHACYVITQLPGQRAFVQEAHPAQSPADPSDRAQRLRRRLRTLMAWRRTAIMMLKGVLVLDWATALAEFRKESKLKLELPDNDWEMVNGREEVPMYSESKRGRCRTFRPAETAVGAAVSSDSEQDLSSLQEKVRGRKDTDKSKASTAKLFAEGPKMFDIGKTEGVGVHLLRGGGEYVHLTPEEHWRCPQRSKLSGVHERRLAKGVKYLFCTSAGCQGIGWSFMDFAALRPPRPEEEADPVVVRILMEFTVDELKGFCREHEILQRGGKAEVAA